MGQSLGLRYTGAFIFRQRLSEYSKENNVPHCIEWRVYKKSPLGLLTRGNVIQPKGKIFSVFGFGGKIPGKWFLGAGVRMDAPLNRHVAHCRACAQ